MAQHLGKHPLPGLSQPEAPMPKKKERLFSPASSDGGAPLLRRNERQPHDRTLPRGIVCISFLSLFASPFTGAIFLSLN
jgi:hypothetical protein